MIKICLFNILSELLILLQLNLVWWHIFMRWIVLWKDWIALLWSQSRSQKRFRIQVNAHLDDISPAAEPSVTKLGLVMQHHGPRCHARRLICCLQVQGHSEGSFDHVWLFLPYLPNCWSFCSQISLDGATSWAGVFCVKIRLLFSRSRSQWRFKAVLNLCVSYIFCTSDLLAK